MPVNGRDVYMQFAKRTCDAYEDLKLALFLMDILRIELVSSTGLNVEVELKCLIGYIFCLFKGLGLVSLTVLLK